MTDWSGSVFVKVITFPDSPMDKPVEAVSVTATDPAVFEVIKEVLDAPTPTVRAPSLLVEASVATSGIPAVPSPDRPAPMATTWDPQLSPPLLDPALTVRVLVAGL